MKKGGGGAPMVSNKQEQAIAPWTSAENEQAFREIMDDIEESIKTDQAGELGINPDPRLIADDTATKTLALSEYLRDFVKNINEIVEIPIELEGQSLYIDELTDFIVENIPYQEAYNRFVKGNPPEKFR